MNFTTQSSDERLQYRLPAMESRGVLSDDTEDEETTKLTGKSLLAPGNSCTNYVDLDAKDNKSKPNRRRSRSSRRAPMIHLNANTTNFRALVQQFTGCQSASSSSFKGPINLNFGGGSGENDLDTADHQSISMFGYKNFVNNIQGDDQDHDQQLQQFEGLQKGYEEDQERVFSYGSFDKEASPSTYGNHTTFTTTMDNMAVENNIFLDDFPGDFSSNGPTDDGFIF